MTKRNINVLTFAPKPNDGTSWWRMNGPFQQLRKDPEAARYTFVPANPKAKYDWDDLGFFDAVIFQRVYNEESLTLLKKCQELGIKTWYEIDDNVFAVQISNPAVEVFSDPKTKDTICKIARMVDVVTVTTGHLKKAFDLLNKNVHVVPNAMADHFLDARPGKSSRSDKVLMWRGSMSHDEDLESMIQAIVAIANEYPDWKNLWFGCPPWRCSKLMPRVAIQKPIPIPRYFEFMAKANADIAYVPLADNVFNRSKSNIAWQEFTLMGAAVVAPAWEEWQRPGVSNYTDLKSYYQVTKELIEDPDLRAKKVEESVADLYENYRLSKVNKLRLKILEELFP